MRKPQLSQPREQGVALVVTLLVVTVLAVVAVAMMQSTTADRMSSRSLANYTRAQLAAQAGLGMATRQLAANMTNDTFIVAARSLVTLVTNSAGTVTTNTESQLFVGNGITNSVNFSYVPLFSTVSNATSPIAPIVTNTVPRTNLAAPGPNSGLAATAIFTNELPGGAVTVSPVVSWVYLTQDGQPTNATNPYVARFAYWVEDLAARLDLSVAGTNTGAASARRPSGTSPAELALWAMINTNAVSAAASGNAGDDLVAARSSLLTPATARLVSSSVTNTMLADLAANLRHDTNEPEMIPFGFLYADEGKPKYNLNTNTNGVDSVSVLASAINKNLPQFGSRGGAMPAAAYVNNIAANIIDYADADANPTVDNPAGPTYLGIENIPWPNELFDCIQFREITAGGDIRIELTDYLEVWNMGNKPTLPTTITIDNNYDMVFSFTNATAVPPIGFSANLKDATAYANPPAFGPREFNIPALQPNEYKVVSSAGAKGAGNPKRGLEWKSPSANKGWVIFVDAAKETTNMSFKAYVGGTLIQQTKGGRWPRHLARTTDGLKLMPTTPNRFIFCNPVGFASQTLPMSASGVPAHSGGDPRAQLFLSNPLRAANYKSGYASPGGRNWESANIATFPESEMNPLKFWPDLGHVAANEKGGVPTDHSQNPDLALFQGATNKTNFVMRRNDTGVFTNIVELGNIYDPLQWADQSGSGVAKQPGLWTNLTASATADARFGGRNTLRVGRWEFTRFTNNGTRASQLLDIFAAGPTNVTGLVLSRVPGRININTASASVLRSLAAGVVNSTDPALQPSGTNFAVPSATVSAFLTGVTNCRAQKPFYAASELATIATNTTAAQWPESAVFGNTKLCAVSEWNDEAAEEWFAKTYPLSTVRSRNFLVYVVGQALQSATTNVISTAQSIYQIYVRPMRDTNAAGLTTNCTVDIIQSWGL